MQSTAYPKEFETAIEMVLRQEGSEYTDDPDDNGGPTRWGITLTDLRIDDKGATADDVRNLSREQAIDIYWRRYWLGIHLDRLPTGVVQTLVFNQGILSGTGTAVKKLQTVLGVASDGMIGPITAGALRGKNQNAVGIDFMIEMQKRYIDIVKSNTSQIKWLRGWMNRTYELLRLCVDQPKPICSPEVT